MARDAWSVGEIRAVLDAVERQYGDGGAVAALRGMLCSGGRFARGREDIRNALRSVSILKGPDVARTLASVAMAFGLEA